MCSLRPESARREISGLFVFWSPSRTAGGHHPGQELQKQGGAMMLNGLLLSVFGGRGRREGSQQEVETGI